MDRIVEMERKLVLLKEKVGNRIFNRRACEGITSIQTLKKYNLVEWCEEKKITEYTLEEIVDALNDTIGQDCYEPFEEGYSYCYEVIDGKPCMVETITGYRLKKNCKVKKLA